MRLLIVEQNQNLVQVIRSVASGEGHEVLVALSGDQAMRVFRQRPADVVLCAMELGDEDGLAVLRRIRSSPSGQEPHLLLTSSHRSRYDPVVQSSLAELSARDFLPQPFSVLDFMDTLRRMAAQRKKAMEASTASTTSPLLSGSRRPDPRNLAQLARLWRSRASGVVRVEGAMGISKGWITLQGGGPANSRDWPMLQELMFEGAMMFERAPVDGQGDWLGMGRMLFDAARDPQQTRYVQSHLYEAPLSTAPPELVAMLPLSDAARSILEESDGVQTLGELVAQVDLDELELGGELYAMQQLRLITLQQPLSRNRREDDSESSTERRRRRRLAAAAARESTAAATSRPAHSVPPPTEPESTQLGMAQPGGRSGTFGSSERAARPRDLSPSVSRSPRSEGGSARRRRRSPRSSSPSHIRRLGRSSVHSQSLSRSQLLSQQDPSRVERRLQHELERLRLARPAVVLAVPPSAEREVILASANRMRRRYARLSRDERLTPAARQSAAALKDLIAEAWQQLRQGRNHFNTAGRAEPEPLQVDASALLREGQRLLRMEQWEMADQLLSRAHKLDAFDASVLAHLGWARFNNPSRGEARCKEGRDFVAVALNLAQQDGDALYYMASISIAEERLDDARELLQAAVQAHPLDNRFRRLARSLPVDDLDFDVESIRQQLPPQPSDHSSS